MVKKNCLVKIPAGKHCPVCGTTQPKDHSHIILKKDLKGLEVTEEKGFVMVK